MNYKAWDKKFERMVQTTELCYVTNEGVFMLRPDMKENLYELLPLENFDIIRPTELKNKNGKEIYEGDIFELTFEQEIYIEGVGDKTIERKDREVVQFINGEYRLGHWPLYQAVKTHTNINLIGNIYEHPHLLEGVK